MSTGKLTKIAVVIIMITIFSGQAFADKVELEQKLNEDIKIDLNDVTIADALKQIGEKAGVEFVLSEGAKWKLPKGEATKLSVSLEGPLSDTLTKMLGDFFMRYAIDGKKITIYPKPELQHIIGRPTIEQLKLLKKIYTNVIIFGGPNGSKVLGKMLSQGLGSGPSITISPLDRYQYMCLKLDNLTNKLKDNTDQSVPMTLSQLLDEAGGRAWYITRSDLATNVIEIRITIYNQFLEAILNQLVDISLTDEKAEVVIEHLKILTESRLEVYKNDPSWLSEKISVNMQNVKLSEALTNIATVLDGEWTFEGENEDKIVMKGPLGRRSQTSVKTTGTATKIITSGEGYVGKISIPMDGGKYFIEFMLRESDLTEELRNLRKAKIKEILEKASAEAAKSQR